MFSIFIILFFPRFLVMRIFTGIFAPFFDWPVVCVEFQPSWNFGIARCIQIVLVEKWMWILFTQACFSNHSLETFYLVPLHERLINSAVVQTPLVIRNENGSQMSWRWEICWKLISVWTHMPTKTRILQVLSKNENPTMFKF